MLLLGIIWLYNSTKNKEIRCKNWRCIKITISSDKGRLSDDEIERMVREAEEFAEEDAALKARIGARNGLESYAFNMKNTLADGEKGIKDKIGDEDAEVIASAVQEVLEWLDDNQEAEIEEYQEKQQELEDLITPLMTKAYSDDGGGDDDFDFDEFDKERDEL